MVEYQLVTLRHCTLEFVREQSSHFIHLCKKEMLKRWTAMMVWVLTAFVCVLFFVFNIDVEKRTFHLSVAITKTYHFQDFWFVRVIFIRKYFIYHSHTNAISFPRFSIQTYFNSKTTYSNIENKEKR